jgi:hypothetical protein
MVLVKVASVPTASPWQQWHGQGISKPLKERLLGRDRHCLSRDSVSPSTNASDIGRGLLLNRCTVTTPEKLAVDEEHDENGNKGDSSLFDGYYAYSYVNDEFS